MNEASTREVRIHGDTVQAWLSEPRAAGRYPAIVMLHGRNGATDAYRDVGVRFAEEGIVALAVNYMTNGNPENPEVVPMIRSALDFLREQQSVAPDRIALSGYCRGGGLTYMGLAAYPEFAAGVVWHGAIPAEAQSINAPVIILHGVSDPTVSIDRVFELAKQLNAQGKPCQLKAYAGCEHAFTLYDGRAYVEDAADDAFREAVLFLRRRFGLPAGGVDPLVRAPVPA